MFLCPLYSRIMLKWLNITSHFLPTLQGFQGKFSHINNNTRLTQYTTQVNTYQSVTILDFIGSAADRRHSLLGHVCCLPPDVPAHNILQYFVNLSQGRCPAPDWKRPPARPRKTWIQQVEEDHGCTIESTRCGRRCRIARCGGRYGPRWSGAAVSE